jgi:hypothetical protein
VEAILQSALVMVCGRLLVSRIWRSLLVVLIVGLLAGAWFSRHSDRSKSERKAVAPTAIPVREEEPTPAPAEAPSAVPTEPKVVDLGGGRLAIGAVTLDRKTRAFTIPAEVNMREGAVEYVLVSRGGKVHEAVFVTDATATDIHVAALLLGLQPEPDLGPENAATIVRKRGAVVIRAEWDTNGPPQRIFLNETVNLSDPSTGVVSSALPSGAWLYNGSRMEADGVFAATRHGSIISIIRDDDALVNNPGASRDNDEIHTPNAAKLPKKGHPVRIVVQVR